MERVLAIVKPYYERVHNVLCEDKRLNPYLEMIEKKTGVSRTYFVSGILVILALYLMFGYAAELVCNVIGFVYPAYTSVKALESRDKDDDTRWLTYWVVYALFSTAEFFTDIFLSWFPFYWLAKCIFLIWCFLPVTWNGSTFIYTRVIRPYFLKNQGAIDKTLSGVQDSLSNAAGKGQKLATAAEALLKNE